MHLFIEHVESIGLWHNIIESDNSFTEMTKFFTVQKLAEECRHFALISDVTVSVFLFAHGVTMLNMWLQHWYHH